MPFDPQCSVSSLAPLPALPTIADTSVPQAPVDQQIACTPLPFEPPNANGTGSDCPEIELAEPATNSYETTPVTKLKSVDVSNVEVSQSGSLSRCQVSFDFVWG